MDPFYAHDDILIFIPVLHCVESDALLIIADQVLQDRDENLQRNIQEVETKCQSLQMTIDRMSLSLAETEENEHQEKARVQVSHYTRIF